MSRSEKTSPVRGKRVLVTGATGTVGSVVVRRLADAGAKVCAMARRPAADVEVVADLVDPAALRHAVRGCDAVVHTAAAISADFALCREVNLEGTRNLLAAMEEEGCSRLIHLSTVSVYDWRGRLEFDEEAPIWSEPLDAYGFSKAEAERAVGGAGVAVTILRPVLVLSTHPKSYWGPLALGRARSTDEPLVPVRNFPYVHVVNLAAAVVLALGDERSCGRSYNVIDGNGATEEYLRAVSTAIGRRLPTLPADAPVMRYVGERIRDELGYAPVDRWGSFLSELAKSS